MDGRAFVLRLYVAGATAASQRAVANLTAICEAHLADRCEIEVVDVYQRAQLAVDDAITAAPTLVRLRPEPVVRILGDLSSEAEVLAQLGLTAPQDDA